MKKKKRDLLSPSSKCCLKKYLDMDLISKYGSLLSILSIFLLQMYNLYIGYNFYTSLFSFFINGIFLFAVLVKIEFITFKRIEPYVNIILKVLIFVLVLNFFGYWLSEISLFNYIFAPISLLGAYLVFMLLIK